MTWLYEAPPIVVVVMGIMAVLILAGGWVQTGQKLLLYAAAAAALLAAAVLLISHLVVTDREQVHATLHQIAADVQRNDLNAVLANLSSNAHEVRQQARKELPMYDFAEVRIRNLKITVEDQPVARAIAEFNVVVVLDDRGGYLARQQIPRFVIVAFEKESDGKWRALHYEHHSPQQGYMKRQQH